jgi:hypothetical protein
MIDKRKLYALKIILVVLIIFSFFHFGLTKIMKNLLNRFKELNIWVI